jgi:tripartite-type tricarboxylate transporter receptor subunit TctC
MSKLCALLWRTVCFTFILTAYAVAQDYPNKNVRIVVPFPPGGFNDIVARHIATGLSERLGKQFIVDNKTGAGGAVAGELVANAPKDGYTLLIVSIAIALNPWLRKLPYDPIGGFAPVAVLATAPIVIVSNPAVPAQSLKEFVALAKQKPGDLKYASSGVGTFLHFGGELFKLNAKIDLLHVPFRGAGPALIDVMGGHTQAAFASVPSVIGHIRSGKLRALAVGGVKRTASLPDVPTAEEAGVPGYRAANWIGVAAPAGTPQKIAALLHKEISAILDSPDLRKRFQSEGVEVMKMGVAEFGDFMKSEHARWGKVVKEAGIKAE